MSDTQKPNTFFMDDKEIDIREGETIFRAGRRFDIKAFHDVILRDGSVTLPMLQAAVERWTRERRQQA